MRRQIKERAAEVRKGGNLGVFADEKVTTEVHARQCSHVSKAIETMHCQSTYALTSFPVHTCSHMSAMACIMSPISWYAVWD